MHEAADRVPVPSDNHPAEQVCLCHRSVKMEIYAGSGVVNTQSIHRHASAKPSAVKDVYICGVMCNNAKGGSGASHCMYLRSEGQVLESCSSWLVPRFSHAAKPQHLPCGILRQALDSGSLPKNEVTDFRTGRKDATIHELHRGREARAPSNLLQDRQDGRGSD